MIDKLPRLVGESDLKESFDKAMQDVVNYKQAIATGSWLQRMRQRVDWPAIREMCSSMAGKFKIVITFCQIISCFNVNFDVPWPSEFIDLVASLSVINLDLLDTISVECTFGQFDYYHTLEFTFWYPIVALITWRLVHLWKVALRRVSIDAGEDGEYSNEESTQKLSIEDLKTEYWSCLLFALFLIYPSITATMLKTFHCRLIDDEWYLYADYRLKCDSGAEGRPRALAFAVMGCILYVAGIPFFFYTVLYVNRHSLHLHSEADDDQIKAEKEALTKWWPERCLSAISMISCDHEVQDSNRAMFRFRPETVHDRLGFLYEDYEMEYSSHELMVLFKKFLLTGIGIADALLTRADFSLP